jgi:integrase/recombinase XerD
LQQIKKEMNINENTQLEPHSLRRAFATHNSESGMPLAILQSFLGHTKISTTAIYVKEAELANLVKYKPI